jgi:hypothetical protein
MASAALKIDTKKSGTSLTTESTEPNATDTIDETTIAALAYHFWQERGCPIGSDQEDWFRAVNDLKTNGGVTERRA